MASATADDEPFLMDLRAGLRPAFRPGVVFCRRHPQRTATCTPPTRSHCGQVPPLRPHRVASGQAQELPIRRNCGQLPGPCPRRSSVAKQVITAVNLAPWSPCAVGDGLPKRRHCGHCGQGQQYLGSRENHRTSIRRRLFKVLSSARCNSKLVKTRSTI